MFALHPESGKLDLSEEPELAAQPRQSCTNPPQRVGVAGFLDYQISFVFGPMHVVR